MNQLCLFNPMASGMKTTITENYQKLIHLQTIAYPFHWAEPCRQVPESGWVMEETSDMLVPGRWQTTSGCTLRTLHEQYESLFQVGQKRFQVLVPLLTSLSGNLRQSNF